MTHEPARYAKLSRPRVYHAMARPRLFAQIDKGRKEHAVVWIASPPGAGKTTLAASYLGASDAPAIWCQVDQGDSDPSTLFFFLSEAVRDAGHVPPALPPEVQGDGARSQRMFFRNLYARLPAGAVLVLDNLHEFDWDNSGQLLEYAFAEVPFGLTILALSRDAPPARLARMEMDGRLRVIGWNELRLDEAEARELSQLGGEEGPVDQQWLDRIDGWAAGVVMLRTLRQGPDQAAAPALAGGTALFRYFAGEILERMPKAEQRMLLHLSCLQSISAEDAQHLTGDADAARLLEQLYHKRLFVERRGASQTYQFHNLFQEFLQHEARQRLAAGERQAFLERAAGLLDQQGRSEAAAQLYQDAGRFDALAALLLRHAELMLATGRGQAWREWMSCLPPDIAEAEPALGYWHGVSLSPIAPLLARKVLVRAAEGFAHTSDVAGRLLTIAAIIDSYDFEWADYRALPGWIDLMTEALQTLDLAALDPLTDLKVHSRLVLGLLFVAPQSPHLAPAAQRALQLLSQVENPVEQLTVGAILLRYFDSVDNANTANWLLASVNKVADDAALSPFHRVWWYGRVARWLNKNGHYGEAQAMAASIQRIAGSFDLDPLLYQFLDAHYLLGTGDMEAAGALLGQLRRNVVPTRIRDQVELNTLDAHWRSQSGDTAGALACALEAIADSAAAGLPAAERYGMEAFAAVCCALQGNFADAEHWCNQADSHAFGRDSVLARETRYFITAHVAAMQGLAELEVQQLREALASHRRRQSTALFPMQPQFAAAIAAQSLAHGMEVEHMRGIIVRQRLQPPDRFTPNWPWPMAVYTLGRLELARDGQVVTATGKAQQRPLLLLKALLAAGEGGKAQQALAAQLWPDADDAKSALNVTVHRLRKMLEIDEAVVVGSGQVSLPDSVVWSDVGALSALCDSIDSLAPEASAASTHRLAAELLQLYRGPFCEGDDESWLLAARERWRNRFLAAAAELGQRLEKLGAWSQAHTLYQRALEAEPLAESSFRGIMRCTHALGDPNAAFSAYRRCRDMLSIVLGRQPSADTEQLAVDLGLK
ncbi:BTAD domain-containing putative transcriptional regulator [Pseudoduganella sp. OTU4001]|uniref:BTAD domain-containing putative transcriptional regulator n=1 Tax=Pseudoduganella sp. OTU4001 TaxID=3043854 RepID=UPI00313E5E6D